MSHVKVTRCRSCGAPKRKASATAYVYCDFCATFTDFDLQKVLAADAAETNRAMQDLAARFAPEIEAARVAKNFDGLVAAHTRYYEAYTRFAKSQLSPRIGDAAYRAEWIRYAATCDAKNALDPQNHENTEALNATLGDLHWTLDGKHPVYHLESFAPMLEAFMRGVRRGVALAREAPVVRHPDGATDELLGKIACSTVAQGWLPYLNDEGQKLLLDRTGHAGTYVDVEDTPLERRSCDGCGAPLDVCAGAARVLCEHCGKLHEIGGASVHCPDCGASVALVANTPTATCPYCRFELNEVRAFEFGQSS